MRKMNTDKFVVVTLAFLIVLMQFNLAIESSNAFQIQRYDFSDHNMVHPKIDKPSAPIDVELNISGTPALGQTVNLSVTATPLADAPNTTVQILFPDEFVLVSGDLLWNGDIAKNETIRLNASMKAIMIGDYVIKASAISEERWTFGKSDSLYISVFETTATVSDKVTIKDSKLSKKVTQLNVSQVLIQEVVDVEGAIPSPSDITGVNLRRMPNFTVKNQTQQVVIRPIQNFTAENQNRVKNQTRKIDIGSIPDVTPINQSSSNLFSTQENVTTRSTVTVFSEDFEGTFPDDNWLAADSNPDSGEDYWDDTSYREYGGSWSGYCADIGDTGSGHEYDNNMYAYMIRKYLIDTSNWGSVTLSYDSWYEIESGYDYLRVIVTDDGGSNWYEIGDKFDGNSGGWGYHSVTVPDEYLTTQFSIGFRFYSDSSVTYEGAYVDNIELEVDVGTITVKGYLDYEDYEGLWRPARWATAYIYDDDVWSEDDLLDTTLVEPDGYFESDPIDNYDSEGGTQDVYIRFVASNSENGVVNADENVYDGYTNLKENVPDGVVDFGYLGTPDGEHGAWEIFDTLNTGWSYYINTLSYDHGYVTCIWYPGSTDGTYVEGENGYRMHVIDGDQMDEDVILHEYGHSVMFGIFGEFPPDSGGPHSWTGHYTPELAWSEGWATYASCMVQDDRYYDDTVDQWVHIDVECQPDGSEWDGDGNGDDTESAVCGLLWDIFDTNDDNNDSFSNGPHDTFDVFRYYITGNHHIYDIHQFWDGWFARGHDELIKLNAIYYDHGIDKNDLPSCTVLFPSEEWYTGTITIPASASDPDGDVAKVEFQYRLGGFEDWSAIDSDISPPDCSPDWCVDWTPPEYDEIWVRARAQDNLGENSEWDESDTYFGVDNTDPGGWQNFTPTNWITDQTPDCTIEAKDVTAGLDVSTARYKYSTNGGSSWRSWLSASCTGEGGTTLYQTITASSVPFNQDSGTQNKIKFKIDDMVGNTGESGEYTVKINTTEISARIRITHHYGDTSDYNGVPMFNLVKVISEGTSPLDVLQSVADVTMHEGRVYSINGITESPPDYWYFYMNGIPGPNEDIDCYKLRDGEIIHWDYSSMINAGSENAFRPYSVMDYPAMFVHGYGGCGETIATSQSTGNPPEPSTSDIAKLIVEGSSPLDLLQSVADVTMREGRVYSINGVTESPPYYWHIYINDVYVPDEDLDSYQLRGDGVMHWEYLPRVNAGE